MPKQRECILVYGFAVSVAWKPFFHFALWDVGSLSNCIGEFTNTNLSTQLFILTDR
jgi:hypothetical protein